MNNNYNIIIIDWSSFFVSKTSIDYSIYQLYKANKLTQIQKQNF